MIVLIPLLMFGAVASIIAIVGLTMTSRNERLTKRLQAVTSLTPVYDQDLPMGLKDNLGRPGLARSIAEQFNLGPKMEQELEGSDTNWTVSQYMTYRGIGVVVGLLAGFVLTQNIFLALVLGLVGSYVPKIFVNMRKGRRLKVIEGQLAETFSMIANALKSGYSFVQSMEAAAREMPPPISDELATVLRDMNVGSTVEAALESLNQRLRSYDIDLALTAVMIQRQVGGNLAEILENVSETIRERFRMKGEVRTLTAQGRLSAYLLGGLPYVLAGVIYFLNPDYMSELFNDPLGRVIMVSAIIQEGIGFFIIYRITNIEV